MFFSYFFSGKKKGFNISCKMPPVETISMQYQILFSGENKKNIINVSSSELESGKNYDVLGENMD